MARSAKKAASLVRPPVTPTKKTPTKQGFEKHRDCKYAKKIIEATCRTYTSDSQVTLVDLHQRKQGNGEEIHPKHFERVALIGSAQQQSQFDFSKS